LKPEDEQLILSFFATKQQIRGDCFDSWVQFLILEAAEKTIARTEPLYYATSYNMLPILRLLLRPENMSTWSSAVADLGLLRYL